MSDVRGNLWQSQSADESENIDSDLLTSSHREPTQCAAAERLAGEATTTVVTNANEDDDDNSEEYYSAPEEEEEEEEDDEVEDDGEDEFSKMKLLTDDGVPAEVKVSFRDNGNDNDESCSDGGSDTESECESEEEMDDDEDAEESEREDNDAVDDFDSGDEYETDEDAPDCEEDSEDFESTDDHSRTDGRLTHELFLPRNVSPCTVSLKYNEDEEDDEDDSSDEEDEPQSLCYRRRAYMTGNNRNSGRPRMWDGCPSGVSVSSDSGSSSEGSDASQSASYKKTKAASKTGVSFSESVTVHPVFETTAYPASVIESIYTGRDELRRNKLRNKREFAYDRHDWRNATEEEEMETDEDGTPMHPVHRAEKKARPFRTRNVVQTYSSALGGYTVGSVSGNGAVHRAKRMRMYYP